MKKRLLSVILAVFMIVPCMFAITACGGSEHTHEWAKNYSSDGEQHWKKCTGCDETTEKENHTFKGDTCSVCGYIDANRTPAKKSAMSDYFSGVKATYAKETVVDSDGSTTKEFKKFVDRQIDVFAKDLLTRLDYVYGEYRFNQLNLNHWGEAYALIDPYSTKGYFYRDMKNPADYQAFTDSTNILAQLSNAEINKIFFDTDDPVTLTKANIEDLADFQRSLLIIEEGENYLADVTTLNLTGATSGQNTALNKAHRLVEDTEKAWKVPNLKATETKDSLKLIIARIISGDSDGDYDTLISKTDKLGFDSAFAEKILNVINEEFIGSDRIEEDDKYYKEITDNYGGIINAENIHKMNESEKYTTTYSPRLYKGYSKLIPAIVKSALENKFNGTNVSLYPSFSNTAVVYTDNADGFTEAHNYESVTLLAKANTPYTKLVAKIKGADLTGSATLGYEVVVNGEAVGTKQNVTITNDGKEIVIDIAKSGAFGNFDGTTDADVNNKVFEQSRVENKNTNNYITILFTNESGVKFVVTFDGYYNK